MRLFTEKELRLKVQQMLATNKGDCSITAEVKKYRGISYSQVYVLQLNTEDELAYFNVIFQIKDKKVVSMMEKYCEFNYSIEVVSNPVWTTDNELAHKSIVEEAENDFFKQLDFIISKLLERNTKIMLTLRNSLKNTQVDNKYILKMLME
jgi:hypothetical protein